MTEAMPVLSAKQVLKAAHMAARGGPAWVNVTCTKGCGAQIFGTPSDIDSGLRKHLEYCEGDPDKEKPLREVCLECGHDTFYITYDVKAMAKDILCEECDTVYLGVK
jgi:hypothetical protein